MCNIFILGLCNHIDSLLISGTIESFVRAGHVCVCFNTVEIGHATYRVMTTRCSPLQFHFYSMFVSAVSSRQTFPGFHFNLVSSSNVLSGVGAGSYFLSFSLVTYSYYNVSFSPLVTCFFGSYFHSCFAR